MKFFINVSFLIVLCFIYNSLNGRNGFPILFFHYLQDVNGLPSSKNYYISQSSDDLIWIGTDAGLYTFNGKEISQIEFNQLDSNIIRSTQITSSLYEDEQGLLWFTTISGLYSFSRSNLQIKAFLIDPDHWSYKGISFSKNETIWLQTKSNEVQYVFKFNVKTKNFTQIERASGTVSILFNELSEPTYMVSTNLDQEVGLNLKEFGSYGSRKVEFQKTSDGYERFYSSPTKCLINTNDTIWVGLYNGIGRYIIGEEEGIVMVERSRDVPKDLGWVHDIKKYDDDQFALASDEGFFLFDKKEEILLKPVLIQNPSYVTDEQENLNLIFFDHNNSVWLANDRRQIAYAGLEKVKFDFIAEVRGKEITALYEDSKGQLWVCTKSDGVFLFDLNHQLSVHSKELHVPGPDFNPTIPELQYFLEDDEGHIWANVANSFFLWSPEKGQFVFKDEYLLILENSISKEIDQCLSLRDGTNLAISGSDIFEIGLSPDKVSAALWGGPGQHISDDIISFYETTSNQILIGTEKNEIFIYDSLGVVKLVRDYRPQDFFQGDSKDTIIIASNNGLEVLSISYVLDKGNQQRSRVIPSKGVSKVIPGTDEDLWLLASDGLLRYNTRTNKVDRFTSTDGLLSNSFNIRSAIHSSFNDKIWLGGKRGVNVFDPKSIVQNQFVPEVSVSRILVNDEEYEIDQSWTEVNALDLPFSENTLSFYFAGLDYSDPNAVEYKYQMEGVDNTQVDNKNKGFARYPNLRPGKYTFKMWASNSDGVLKGSSKNIDIRIRPPFYLTWWFLTLCVFALSGAIYAFFRYRLEQALKVERLRVKISSDLHDDVGGLLSGLAMQSEILELKAPEKDKQKLRRIAELSRAAMSRMRDTVWAIDARKDKIEDLKDRMIEHAEESIVPKGFEYSIKFGNVALKDHLSTEIRQNIYLIYKESVTNIAKHSIGDRVEISLEKARNSFVLRVWDNGIYKLKDAKSSGLGLSNMRMRAEAIGGRLSVDDTSGFEVLLTLPR